MICRSISIFCVGHETPKAGPTKATGVSTFFYDRVFRTRRSSRAMSRDEEILDLICWNEHTNAYYRRGGQRASQLSFYGSVAGTCASLELPTHFYCFPRLLLHLSVDRLDCFRSNLRNINCQPRGNVTKQQNTSSRLCFQKRLLYFRRLKLRITITYKTTNVYGV